MLHHRVQRAVLPQELQGRLGPDPLNGLQVVAAEEDAQLDELQYAGMRIGAQDRGWGRTRSMFISRPSSAFSRLISEMGVLRASEKVRWRYRIGALNVSVSISSEPAA